MASIFAALAAMLASAIFAFETTLQPFGMLPLLGSCAAAYLVSSLLMRNSIMTEKISRRGVKTPDEYVADPLDQILVRTIATKQVVTLNSRQTIAQDPALVRDEGREVFASRISRCSMTAAS